VFAQEYRGALKRQAKREGLGPEVHRPGKRLTRFKEKMMLKRKPILTICKRILAAAFLMIGFLILPAPIRAQSDDDIKVHVTLMEPRIVSDTFGKRIAQRFIALQVTVTNRNKDFQYMINDVTLDLRKVFVTSQDQYMSSAELSLLRGVAEKGQGQDTRNKTLRLFRGIGTIAAGLIGVTSFGPSFPKAVAIFNGPVISAFSEAFPDYTINQMNRLNDSAYQANTLISTKHSKVMVAFLPQAIFLNKAQMQQFWNDPTTLYPLIDFRKANPYIDGSFITEVSTLPPVVSSAQFDSTEIQNFQNAKPIVKGYITGRFLSGTSIGLLNQDPKGLSIALDGAPTANRLNFIVKSDKPVPPGTNLNFEVANANGVQTYTKPIGYLPDPPTLNPLVTSSAKQGAPVILTLTGTNFIPGPGNTRVNVTGGGIEVLEPTEVMGNSLKVTFKIDPSASVGPRNVTVVNANGESAPVTFTISAAAPNP
jgi:hypothetical protein